MNTEQLMEKVKVFLKDEEGLTMVEYAVAGGMIAAAGVGAFQALGLSVQGVINGLEAQLATVPGGAPAG